MSTVQEWLAVRGERDLCLQYTNDLSVRGERDVYLQYTNDYQQEVRGIYVYSTRMAVSKMWEGFMFTVHEWLSVRGEMDLCLQYTNDNQ